MYKDKSVLDDYSSLFFSINNKDYIKKSFTIINNKNDHIFQDILPKYFNGPCRTGQLMMSQDIVDSLDCTHKSSTNLMVEAGVGIGKSFAYLVPILLYLKYFKGKIVLSTSSILLQNQLESDINVLTKILISHQVLLTFPEVLIAKGKTRYICIKRLNEYSGQNKELQDIKTKYDKNKSLKRLQDIENEYSEIDQDICVKNCIKKKCEFCDKCSYFMMRKQAKSTVSNMIIITNHDMFVNDRKLYQQNPDYAIFGKVNYVVFDEAHNLEDKVRNAYLFSMSFRYISSTMKRIRNKKVFNRNQKILDLCDELARCNSILFNRLYEDITDRVNNMPDKEKPLRLNFEYETYSLILNKVKDILADIQYEVAYSGYDSFERRSNKDDNSTEDTIKDVQISLNNFEMYLDAIINRDANYFTWVEFDYIKRNINRKSISINTSVRNIGEWLRYLVFNKKDLGCLLTSATLSSSSNVDDFDDPEDAYAYISESIGLKCDQNTTLLNEPINSPYDYKENMKIFIDAQVPPPTPSNHFIPELSHAILNAVNMTQGRSLILFTSKYDMNEVYRFLTKSSLPYEIFVQKGNSFEVLKKFKDNEQSILLSTGNFWEGINVPGRTLSQVIIARLPFPVPDPISEDKKRLYIEKNGDASHFIDNVVVPEMLIKLRQGIGRLIRNENDKGIITILDSRIASHSRKKYKDIVIKSLPVSVEEYRDKIIEFAKEILQ